MKKNKVALQEAPLEPYKRLFEECAETFTADEVPSDVDAMFFLMCPDLEEGESKKKYLKDFEVFKERFGKTHRHHAANRNGLLTIDVPFTPRLIVALPPRRKIITFAPVGRRDVYDNNRYTFEIITPWQYTGFSLYCGRDKGLYFSGQYSPHGYTTFSWDPPEEASDVSFEFIPNGGCEGRRRNNQYSLAEAAEYASEFFDYGLNFDGLGGGIGHENSIISSLAMASGDEGATAITDLKKLVEDWKKLDRQKHYNDEVELSYQEKCNKLMSTIWLSAFEQWERESLESLRENHQFRNVSKRMGPTPYKNPYTSRALKLNTREHEHNVVVYDRLVSLGGVA